MTGGTPDLLQPPLPLQLVWLGLLAVATLDWLRRGWRDGQRKERRLALGLLVALAAVGLARWLTDVPQFLHANLHGPALLGDILGFPRLAEERAEYGCGHPTLVGLLAALFGRRWEVVAHIDQAFGIATLGLVAWQAQRWLARPSLAYWVLAVAALAPALTRIAASEDAHTSAALMACLATLALDRYGRRRQGADLVLAVLAAGWMLWTRQTLILWLPVAVALPLLQHRDLRRDPKIVLTVIALLALLGLRVVASWQHPGDHFTYMVLLELAKQPAVLLPLLSHHPLFSPEFSLFTAPLLLFGWVLLPQAAPLGRPLAGALLALLVATLLFGVPALGSNLGFRISLLLLALVPQALAAQWLADRLGKVQPALAVALAAAPMAMPSWQPLHELAPLDREYTLLRTLLPQLPKGAALAVPALHEPAPAWTIPRHLLPPGSHLIDMDDRAPRNVPVYWVLGVACRARSPLELLGGSDARLRAQVAADSYRMVAPQAPATLRSDCAKWLATSRPVGPVLRLAARDELPFALYGGAPVTLALMIRPAAAAVDPTELAR